MARNQHSWGLKFFVASIVLIFCLAVTTVEGRSIPFVAQLTPEYTQRVTSANREFVGQAFAHVSSAGNDFHLYILVVSNINPASITKVQLYNVEDRELVGEKFIKLSIGYQIYDARVSFDIGHNVNLEKTAVNIYTKEVGSSRPALSGLLVNNRTTYLASLRPEEEITPPTGVSKNDGFATAVVWSPDNINYFLSLVVNHDLNPEVTAIHLHAPAASNTNGVPIINLTLSLTNAGKILNVPISSTVKYWLDNHLGYINVHTAANPAGALRGQLIPTTTPRYRTPLFPNKATVNVAGTDFTSLPDGGAIIGSVGLALKQGGARNLTGNDTDVRVSQFVYNATTKSFDNDFRFALPVSIPNRFSVRSAVFYVDATTESIDHNKFSVGVVNVNTLTNDKLVTIAGNGRRAFIGFQQINLNADNFQDYLGPGGVFVNVNAASLAGPGLFVDRFYMVYYVVNAYANNLVKSIFFRGSPAI
jgi:hypothetical protein